jgi:hypothetical protein
MKDLLPNAKTQRGEILGLLIKAHGDWVPLPQIMACAAQYNARVFELRRLGFGIENRTEIDVETGQKHSWFRLVGVQRSSDWYERDHGARPKSSEPTDGLPLFTAVQP